jgi:hypothetical protein
MCKDGFLLLMWAALFARLLPQAYQRLTSLQVRK